MSLTEAFIRSTGPIEKPRKLFDSGGLYLLVTPRGSRLWRLKYRFGGKEKSLSLGIYPEVTLGAARRLRDEARALLVAGVNPGEVRSSHRGSAAASLATHSVELIDPPIVKMGSPRAYSPEDSIRFG
ncbi:Arm DNA-binding domain-containing protein [Paraburkholderia acidisoli]|uniref:DUF4102 domain-containing protein n=1 Tax=Paraburkholderia acidisoli TaxID=2571748 RepID=A0A7Z2JEQ7_9BURK|nr:Arm DNA-binding domain-containing protein [Paraburkholderia acidisoli]QGZ60350.1 DUF4102 domain-containing protein [Paraburkholderia acidisoli]